MPTSSSPRVVARHSAMLLPNRPANHVTDVLVPRRLPCTTILIHGVNDLGTDFGTVEGGLCEGLNDRLGRGDIKPADYKHGRMANDDPGKKPVTAAELMKNLDDVLYRRQENSETYSPLIPFYWGVRAGKDELPKDPAKQTVNGQYVDKFGNRLDAHRAKNGGFFANAATNIPDMFGTHFMGGPATALLNFVQNDPTHPLFEAPDRHYMVLAAVRLAALVRQIRLINPDETVNIIAHSQGTLITLLAQAFLINGLDPEACSVGDRPADTLILIDSPYSLEQETIERMAQSHDNQQTTYARAKTLANLTQLVAQAKHGTPPFDSLSAVDAQGKIVRDNCGVTGTTWTPEKAMRIGGPKGGDNAVLAFAERDNRGKVYLYFCPEDATVGMTGVNGMGAAGLPDSISVRASHAGSKPESVPLLSDSFRQRLFTRRLRNGKPVLVGTEPGPFTLREQGESSHGTSGYLDTHFKRAEIPVGTVRTINGEALPPPFEPELQANVIDGTQNKPLDGSASEVEPGEQALDQLEAEIALSTNSGVGALHDRMQTIPWPTFEIGGMVPDNAEVANVLNAGKDPDDQCRVLRVQPTLPPHTGKLQVLRGETPNEAKLRLMNEFRGQSSYHSAVMSGRRNHRCATAFDVAIGEGRAVDDPVLAKLLRSIADWRISLDNIKKGAALERYNQFDRLTREIVEATCVYYDQGTFPPEHLVPRTPPHQVVSEIYKEQEDFKKQEEQRLAKQRTELAKQKQAARNQWGKSQLQRDMEQLQQRLGQQADAARQGLDRVVEQGEQAVQNLIDKF